MPWNPRAGIGVAALGRGLGFVLGFGDALVEGFGLVDGFGFGDGLGVGDEHVRISKQFPARACTGASRSSDAPSAATAITTRPRIR